jgi:oxygen-independent coproporphyrinogen-3 oxidase
MPLPALIPPPLSLYVHLPWCVRKCPYCDFNSHAAKGAAVRCYIDALMRDLDQDLPLVWGRVVHACSSAAARPACSRPKRSTASCSGQRAAAFAPGAEITLETNPARPSTAVSTAIAPPA